MASRYRHISPELESSYNAHLIKQDDKIVGIELEGGRKIYSNQGCIATESETDDITAQLESLACSSSSSDRKRKFGLPEMLFLQAQVKIECGAVDLQFTALDALKEWAEAHAHLSMSHTNEEYRGVSVLKSRHAWNHSVSNEKSMTTPIFFYDWTFSTPYCGSCSLKMQPTPESTLPMQVLQNTSIPMIYYDHVVLYEDDMHDNGQVSLSLKLRVMANSCVFVLQRLYVRVDQVLVRVRDVRSCWFENQLHQTVTWKECPWDDLPTRNLTKDTRMWRNAEQPDQQAVFQSMLDKLPTVALPKDVHEFSQGTM